MVLEIKLNMKVEKVSALATDKWAELLEADAYEKFKETGIFNKETASSFKDNILSKGNTDHPMNLYVKFRGREPKVDALLKKSGLSN